jgi:hypothetical protein
MRMVFVISGVIISMAVIVTILLGLNKLEQSQNQKTIELELRQAKLKIAQLESEKQQLASKLMANDKEMLAFKDKLTNIQKQLDTTIQQLSGLKAPSGPKSINSGEPMPNGQSMNETALKAQRMGQLFSKMLKSGSFDNSKGPTTEQAKIMGEMIALIGELNMVDMMNSHRGIDKLSIFSNLGSSQIFQNMAIGMLDELGKPMSKIQIGQYEDIMTKLAEIAHKNIFVGENQTSTEKVIAYLEHAGEIKLLSKELATVFTQEQKDAMANAFKELHIADEMPFLKIPEVEIHSDISKVDKSAAMDQIFRQWETSSPEKDANIKIIIDEYLKEYSNLRKTLESCYDKDVMAYYYERNAPAEGSRIEYNEEKDKLFTTDIRYINAKAALDVDFLRLQSKFEKELVRLAGEDRTHSPVLGSTVIHHYPNVE